MTPSPPSPEEKTIESSACDRIPDGRCFQITFKWPIRDVTCKGCLNKRERSSSWLFVELYPEPSPSLTGGSLEINRSCLCCPPEVPVQKPWRISSSWQVKSLSLPSPVGGRRHRDSGYLVKWSLFIMFYQRTGMGLCNRKGVQEGDRSRAGQEEVRRGTRNKEWKIRWREKCHWGERARWVFWGEPSGKCDRNGPI